MIRASLLLFVLIAATHFAWVKVMGPPARWGTAVVDLELRFEEPTPEVEAYAAEFPAEIPTGPVAVVRPRAGSDWVLGRDAAGALEVMLTFEGPRWGDGQHLFINGNEVALPRERQWNEPVIVDGELLLVGWRSWWPHSYLRFWRSLFDPELRAEWGVYRVRENVFEFLFPGSSLVVSPDRRRVAYLASENSFGGWHTLWIREGGVSRAVATLRESDPGSGVSFAWSWSRDGRALLVYGTGVRFVYLLDGARVVDFRG